MTVMTWNGDWRGDLEKAASKLGFATLSDFAVAKPEYTYGQLATELANALGREFAPVQVEHSLRDLAVAQKSVDAFAAASFVRHLRNLMPEGWQRGPDPIFAFAHSYGAWRSRLPDEIRNKYDLFDMRIRILAPPVGWLPNGPDDPIIVEAFQQVPCSDATASCNHTGKR